MRSFLLLFFIVSSVSEAMNLGDMPALDMSNMGSKELHFNTQLVSQLNTPRGRRAFIAIQGLLETQYKLDTNPGWHFGMDFNNHRAVYQDFADGVLDSEEHWAESLVFSGMSNLKKTVPVWGMIPDFIDRRANNSNSPFGHEGGHNFHKTMQAFHRARNENRHFRAAADRITEQEVGYTVNTAKDLDNHITLQVKDYLLAIENGQAMDSLDKELEALGNQIEENNQELQARFDGVQGGMLMTQAGIENIENMMLEDRREEAMRAQKMNDRSRILLNRAEAVGAMQSIGYIGQLLGNEDLAIAGFGFADVYSKFNQLTDMAGQGYGEFAIAGQALSIFSTAVSVMKALKGKKRKKDPYQQLMKAIQALSEQMHLRFDRIESMLLSLHSLTFENTKMLFDILENQEYQIDLSIREKVIDKAVDREEALNEINNILNSCEAAANQVIDFRSRFSKKELNKFESEYWAAQEKSRECITQAYPALLSDLTKTGFHSRYDDRLNPVT